MPKMKSHSGAKKRVRKTASGRYKSKKSGGRHLLVNKSESRMRRIKGASYIHETQAPKFDRMLPYA